MTDLKDKPLDPEDFYAEENDYGFEDDDYLFNEPQEEHEP